MSKQFIYEAIAVGFLQVKPREEGETIVSHDKPLPEAKWYVPVNEHAKEAWGSELPADSAEQEPEPDPEPEPSEINPELVMEAFDQLDHGNDDHWTSKGSPKMAVLNEFYAHGELTNADIKELGLKRVKIDDQ